jgi:hypothetical protein
MLRVKIYISTWLKLRRRGREVLGVCSSTLAVKLYRCYQGSKIIGILGFL